MQPTPTRMSSRQFNQDVSLAKRNADSGPVVITDRGRPAYVLLRHDDDERLAGPRASLLSLLASPDVEAIDVDPPRLSGGLFRTPDFDLG